VFEELRRIIFEIEMPELHRFQTLRKRINDEMMEYLMTCLKPTNQMVKNLIMVQDSYINTYHPDFVGGIDSVYNLYDPQQQQKIIESQQYQQERPLQQRLAIQAVPVDDSKSQEAAMVEEGRVKSQTHGYELEKYMQKDVKPINMPRMQSFKRAETDDPGQSSHRATMETSIIKGLIVSYFDTVRKTINDMVPKTVMAFLVNKAKNQSQHVLVQKIYSEGVNLNELLSEDHDTKIQRENCEQMIQTLKMSLEFLNEVRDFYFEEGVGQ